MKFADDFFRREIRSGFEVSEMMKRAWAAQMEVLQVIADICRENNLQYFADWGTLLGAVRHKGFIPWDDDIDICLKREDYNRLVEILPGQLPYGFVLAGMYAKTERLQQAAYVPHMRVIADETLWNFNDYMRYFHGFPYQRVGLDIFPLDYMPFDNELAKLQMVMVQRGIIILRDWDTLQKDGELEDNLKIYEELCGVEIPHGENRINWMWRLVDRIASLYQRDEGEYMTNFATWITIDGYRVKKEWYDKAIMIPFENIEIAVPEKYDAVLTAQYGDYMIPAKGTAYHDYPFYGHMESELIKQIQAVGFTGSVEEFCQKVSNGELRV